MIASVELLERAVDQRAVRPRAAVRDIEMIAPGLGLEAGRAVGGDAVAEAAVGALELAGRCRFPAAARRRSICRRSSTPIRPPPRAPAPRRCGSPRYWRGSARRAALEHGGAGDQHIGAGRAHRARVLRRDAAVDLDVDRPPAGERAQPARSSRSAAGMKVWPPKPGLTDITSIEVDEVDHRLDRSRPASPGLSVTPAFLPSARIACSERCRCGPASTCTVMMSEPALAKASR